MRHQVLEIARTGDSDDPRAAQHSHASGEHLGRAGSLLADQYDDWRLGKLRERFATWNAHPVAGSAPTAAADRATVGEQTDCVEQQVEAPAAVFAHIDDQAVERPVLDQARQFGTYAPIDILSKERVDSQQPD